jgi:uncharacterized delta-60 repeat protein
MLQRVGINIIACLLLSTTFSAQNLIPDENFGKGGCTSTSFKTLDSRISALALQPDKKIIACGSAFSGHSNRLAIARFNSDGSIDESFGTSGKVLAPFGTYMEYETNTLQVLKDGSILVAATNGLLSDQHIVLLKFTVDGKPEKSFGSDGVVKAVFQNKSVASSLAIQSDGKIVVGGKLFEEFSLDYTDFLISRFLPDGTPDDSFGVKGSAIINFGTTINRHAVSEDAIYTLKLQPDGKILAAGYTYAEPTHSTSDFALLRLNFDGSPDTTFGKNGRVITNFKHGETAHTMQLLDDGKIILGGILFFNDDSSQKACLAKYNIDGSLDKTFGHDGKLTTDLNGGSASGFTFSSILQKDGKLLLTGYINNVDADLLIIRYNPDGDLDETFGDNGQFTADVGGNETAYTSISQPDGTIFLGGSTQSNSYRSFLLTKFKPELQSNFEVGSTTFSVSPNPFTQYIDVEFSLKKSEPLHIEIVDSAGNSITSVIPDQPCGAGCISERIVLPETLSEGMYFLNVSNGATVSTVKIQKTE